MTTKFSDKQHMAKKQEKLSQHTKAYLIDVTTLPINGTDLWINEII